MNIIIIDYDMGNVGSIFNMLKKIGLSAKISSNHNDILLSDKLILPGVGAFDKGMLNLEKADIISLLNEKVMIRRTPILGICLGMQLFTRTSEEGNLPGLGWIDADTKKFQFNYSEKQYRIPHMGWNTVTFRKNNFLFDGFVEEPRFYFVHSYHVSCDNEDLSIAKTLYGYEFTSAIQRDNIFGVQFHPEKSHKFGMKLLINFINYS